MTQDDVARWRKEVYERIAAAVRNARRDRSAQDIADETARLGCSITRSQISNFETGRRQSFDITELLVLAAALRVPPLALLFGGHPDHDAEVLPGRVVSTVAALAWFTGERDLAWPAPDVDPGDVLAQLDAAVADRAAPQSVLLDLTRARARKRKTVEGLVALALKLNDGDIEKAAEHRAEILAELARMDDDVAAAAARVERGQR